MAYPVAYDRAYDFQSYQNANPTRPLPGDKVNADLNAVAASFDEVVAFLQGIARADGRLANGSVGVDQLDASLQVGFSLPTYWEPNTAYVTTSTVFHDNGFYLALVAHTSGGSFDSSKWTLIADLGEQADIATAKAAEAAASAAAALVSEGNADTSETNAAASAAAALVSEGNAGTSETNAAASAAAALVSEGNAGTSETNAAASAAAALVSEGNADTSETNAAASAAAALVSEGNAGTSETNAAASAAAALVSEGNAGTSETNAAASAAAALVSEGNASNSADAAAVSAASAASLFDLFDDSYLGSKTSDPTLNNDGNALQVGALYWNSSAGELRVYSGSAWVAYSPTVGITALVDDTTPQLGGDLDANGHNIGFDDGTGIEDDAGNEQMVFGKTASAVNHLKSTNAATGNAPSLAAVGDDTNIDLNLVPKGTGKVAVEYEDSGTTTVPSALKLSRSTSGTAANGIGVRQEFEVENGAGTLKVAAALDVISTDVTDTSEDFDLSVKLMAAGAAVSEVVRFLSTGVAYLAGNAAKIILHAAGGQTLTGGFNATPYNAGTKSSGTYTPLAADGNFQYATNGGAHTLAPPANPCSICIEYTNNGSAGTITTSSFTRVTGDSITTTNGHKFLFFVTKHQTYSHLFVQALQ